MTKEKTLEDQHYLISRPPTIMSKKKKTDKRMVQSKRPETELRVVRSFSQN